MSIKELINSKHLVLDGALGTELEALIPKSSAVQPKSNPLWSGMVLLNEPKLVQQVHYQYLNKSNVDLLTTSTYQVSYDSLKKFTDLDDEGIHELWNRSVQVITNAIAQHNSETPESDRKDVKVLGSIGPYATFLADGSEYTGVYKDVTMEQLEMYHLPLTTFFLEHPKVDAICFETIPTFIEVKAILKMMAKLLSIPGGTQKYFSISFNFPTEKGFGDRTSVKQVVSWLVSQLEEDALLKEFFLGIGLNCLDYNYISPIVQQITEVCAKEEDMALPLILYPNLGFYYDEASDEYKVNKDMKKWESLVKDWLAVDQVKVIGGCCSTSPVEIKVVRDAVDQLEELEKDQKREIRIGGCS